MTLKYTRPGFPAINFAHPANKNIQFSFVASPGLSAFDLVKKQFGTKLGSPVRVTDKVFGESLQFGSLNTDGFSFAGRGTKGAPGTIAFIGILNSTAGGSRTYFHNSSAASGLCLDNQSSGSIQLVARNVAVLNPTISVSTATPYLAIFSLAANFTVNALLLNLSTGAITTGTSTNGSGPTTANGTFLLGNLDLATQGANADLSALLWSNTFLTLDQMKAWAKDPWGPWRGVSLFDVSLLMMSAGINYISGTKTLTDSVQTATLINAPFGGDHWSTTFNPSNVTLSNNNFTATATAHNVIDTIIGIVGHSLHGKYYFEIEVASTAGGVDAYCGIAKASNGNSSRINTTGVSINYGGGTAGTFSSSGSTSHASGLTVATGMILGFVIDFDAGMAYVRDTAAPSAWYGNGAGADPVAGTGGFDWSVLNTGTQYIAWTSNQNGIDKAMTMNAGAGSFIAALPSGCRAWNAVSSGDGNETAVSVIS